MKDDLKKAIIDKQGDMLYITLSEECAEVIQACTKIQRAKYHGKDFSDRVDNLLEEINDVLINIELIKCQLLNEESLNLTEEELNKRLEEWKQKKTEKCIKIFL